MQIEEAGDYLKPEHVKKNKKITLTSEMEYKDGKFGRKLNVIVILKDGSKKTWTPNGKSINYLRSTLGEKSDDWNGKEITLELVKQATNNGIVDVIYPEGAI